MDGHHSALALERYLKEMEVNSVASALAAEVNQRFSPPPEQKISYVLSSVAEVTSTGGQPFFFVEQYLEGDFTRFSFNTGFWDDARLNEWLLRFALWTYEVTDGFMMVADRSAGRSHSKRLCFDRPSRPLQGPQALWEHQTRRGAHAT